MGMNGGPGTNDPTRFTWDNCYLGQMISQAYGVSRPRILGLQSMALQTFDVVAKVPLGARKDQLTVMIRNLLIDRFRLATHFEKREMAAYELVIAKGGIRFKPTAARTASSEAEEKPIWARGLDRDGYVNLPPTFKGAVTAGEGKTRFVYSGESMGGFADWLSDQTRKPVIDETGLKGIYDLDFKWQADASDGPPALLDFISPLIDALPAQVGLKLESKKRRVEVLVIDHVEKIPTAN
jgi:bla regulator protein BlaR1